MAGDALPGFVDRELGGDQRRELLGHIGPHAIMTGPRLLRRVDVEACAQPKIISFTAGHAFAARARVRRNEDQSELGAGGAIFAFLRDVGMSAGEARQIPDNGKLASALRLPRKVDREGHIGAGGQ